MHRKYLYFFLLITGGSLAICLLSDWSISASLSPPYSSITISGIVKEPYDKVGLFTDEHAIKPNKVRHIDCRRHSSRQYTITIDIPTDMVTDGNDYFINLRFWKDTNDNNITEQYEPSSASHFVVWNPQANEISLEVCKGPTYKIDAQSFKYDLE